MSPSAVKIPETVVDKGGLFFDDEGRLTQTKEWYDMTESEKEEMWDRWHRSEAYTNTGITLIRKSVLIERIDSAATPHKPKQRTPPRRPDSTLL